MNLDKLRSLTEQASPGEWTWRTGESFDKEWGDKGHGAAVLDAEGNIEGGPLIILSGELDDDERDRANIRLASLVKHLLPLAKALEGLAVAKNHGFGCWARADEPDIRCEVEDGLDALKALQEALDGN